MPPGKVVTSFYYMPEDDERGTQIEVPVRLVQRIDREKVRTAGGSKNPGNTCSAHFEVWLDEPVKIRLRSENIEVLRAAVFASLDEACEIKWEAYYIVRVIRESIYRGQGDGLTVSYEDVQLGRTPDGREVYRQYHSHEGYRVEEGRPSTKITRGEESVALIPASDENKKAMRQFLDGMGEMRKRIGEFLHQDVIDNNLARLTLSTKLLPAPNGDTVSRKESDDGRREHAETGGGEAAPLHRAGHKVARPARDRR